MENNLRLAVVTGTSRGLGEAIAAELHQNGFQVLGLARNQSALLEKTITQISVDLSQPMRAVATLLEWLSAQNATKARQVMLINNAALLPTPDLIGRQSDLEQHDSLLVGLNTPIMLINAMTRLLQACSNDRRVLNISSGLGRRAMAGSANYCAQKAGLDHFSRAYALEQAQCPAPIRIESLAPGVIDTAMQLQLRSADQTRFTSAPSFKALHDEGKLAGPKDTAEKIVQHLLASNFGQEVITDIRDLRS